MNLTPEQFDALVHYTLRIELLNGKVLIYPIDTVNKHYVSNRLRSNADGWDEEPRPFPFLWFETVKDRNVIIANDSIARITLCFDYHDPSDKPVKYHDNFNLLGKAPIMEEWETDDGESEIVVFGDDPPGALIYHKGAPPEDGYGNNPLTYNNLEDGCLGPFFIELEGECPLRKFINLTDEDGEENFIPTAQILVMEFDHRLLYQAEELAGEEDDEDDEDEDDWMPEDSDEDDEAEENRKNNDLPW